MSSNSFEVRNKYSFGKIYNNFIDLKCKKTNFNNIFIYLFIIIVFLQLFHNLMFLKNENSKIRAEEVEKTKTKQKKKNRLFTFTQLY